MKNLGKQGKHHEKNKKRRKESGAKNEDQTLKSFLSTRLLTELHAVFSSH